jgi:hypothetical protein
MRLFECQYCAQPLYFENDECLSCGHRLGYLPGRGIMTALEPTGDAPQGNTSQGNTSQANTWRAAADPGTRYRSCANAQHGVCNWLLESTTEIFCAACRHNRTIPNLAVPGNLAR